MWQVTPDMSVSNRHFASVVGRKLYVLAETSSVVLDTIAVLAVIAAQWKYKLKRLLDKSLDTLNSSTCFFISPTGFLSILGNSAAA